MQKVQVLLQQRVKVPVELAMRYQNPSVPDAIKKLAKQGVTELFLLPLFPHYAMSSYETAVVWVQENIAKYAPQMKLTVQAPYYNSPDYIAALAAVSADAVKADFDHLLISFHGVPERQIKKSDPTKCHCLTVPNCCEVASPAHEFCYRAQCFQTAILLAQQLGLPKEKWSVSFQSRLGRAKWIEPYTEARLDELAAKGVKKLLVMCPAFVADCIETLEEIGQRGREQFVAAGGEDLVLVPCLNDHPAWSKALAQLCLRAPRLL